MLPEFVIIGAMKSGTSSLHRYLQAHPEIFMSTPKEIDFFNTHHDKGQAWYEAHFQVPGAVRGEASVNYTKYPLFKDVPERMHAMIPEAKLIYLLRDPVERIVSQYVHSYAEGLESRSLDDCLAVLQDNHYVRCSSYHMQLERYLPYYSADRILILAAEELRSRREETLAGIFSFLGVDNSFASDEFTQEYHRSEGKRRKDPITFAIKQSGLYGRIKPYLAEPLIRLGKRYTGRAFAKPELTEAQRQALIACLGPDVQALREFTGQEFSQWCL